MFSADQLFDEESCSMAQGQIKKKGGKNPKKTSFKKGSGPKKGARTIAPKKARHIKAAKLKKTLDKAIKSKIEQELAGQAVSKGSRPLTMVKVDEQEKSEGKKKGKKNK